MIYYYFLISIITALLTLCAKQKRMVNIIGSIFYGIQIASIALLLFGDITAESAGEFFSFDKIGMLFFGLLTIVSTFVFFHSTNYLKDSPLREYRLYFTLLMILTTAITGAYFANNLAVTWIFLEATTLCSAGIIYHRHSPETLEAAWKYIFVCSTGIAMAYLGILLLSSLATQESLSYELLTQSIANGDSLFLKTAFLLIICGYSCKMEIFPLYTVGVDANYAAPSPAAALLSTGVVNAGFIAIFRVYKMIMTTEIAEWAGNVLIIVGVISLAIGALFLRRTNNYKRFLSYSTVENMGIVAIGLGVGGLGIWAAIFHIVFHTLIKTSLYLQMAIIRKYYNGYQINRIGNYININKVGGISFIIGTILILAFPPSPLFISEVIILKEIIVNGEWWLISIILLLLCIVIYSIATRMIRLCYQGDQDNVTPTPQNKFFSWSALSLIIIAIVIGIWQPHCLEVLINEIATL